jgi:hypothetical protein
MTTTHDLVLRHEPEQQRFVAELPQGSGVLEYRQRPDGTLDYYHTFVPDALRGGGVASRLVKFALDHALEHGLRVMPSCPFVAAVIDRNDKYRGVLTQAS